MECDNDVQVISMLNKDVCFDTTLDKFTATNSDLLYIPALSYNLLSTAFWLFSPQAYHKLHGGLSELYGDRVVMHLRKQPDIFIQHDIKILFDHHQSNLIIIANTA